MRKRRDKRKRKAKELATELNQLTIDVGTWVPGNGPSTLGEPDVGVRAPQKPNPHIRPGAIAVPEPDGEKNP